MGGAWAMSTEDWCTNNYKILTVEYSGVNNNIHCCWYELIARLSLIDPVPNHAIYIFGNIIWRVFNNGPQLFHCV